MSSTPCASAPSELPLITQQWHLNLKVLTVPYQIISKQVKAASKLNRATLSRASLTATGGSRLLQLQPLNDVDI